jgi:hypothetical protein
MSEANEKQARDRPAKNPGGMECEQCGCIFIGESWHIFCAVCVKQVADDLAARQNEGSHK